MSTVSALQTGNFKYLLYTSHINIYLYKINSFSGKLHRSTKLSIKGNSYAEAISRNFLDGRKIQSALDLLNIKKNTLMPYVLI